MSGISLDVDDGYHNGDVIIFVRFSHHFQECKESAGRTLGTNDLIHL